MQKANEQKGDKVCSCCGQKKNIVNGFYISASPLFALDKRVPLCKACIISSSLNEDGTINEIEFNKILRKIDKPYYKDYIESSMSQFKKEHSYVEDENIKKYGKEILQLYFKNIGMRQDKTKSYEDSEKDGFMHTNNNRTVEEKIKIKNSFSDIENENKSIKSQTIKNESKDEEKYYSDSDDFVVTEDLLELFGEGYTKNEYRLMKKKFDKMKINYTIQTNLHEEALATYVRFKVKEEQSTAEGNVGDADKWNKAAQEAADNAKLTPKQLTQADLHGGINSFSEIFKAVEQAVDVIPILPKFKYRPDDALDFNIWCYINYARDLQGLPSCEYEDVYKFYDKKKQEYLDQYGDQYGIFDDDPTEKNRESVKKFITLPKDYDDGNE